MRTHSEIVSAAGRAEDIAERLGVSVHTVRSWGQRNSIPAEHWPALVSDGTSSYEELAATKPPRRTPDQKAAA